MGDKLINIVNKYNTKLCFIELERLAPIFNGKINGKYFIKIFDVIAIGITYLYFSFCAFVADPTIRVTIKTPTHISYINNLLFPDFINLQKLLVFKMASFFSLVNAIERTVRSELASLL